MKTNKCFTRILSLAITLIILLSLGISVGAIDTQSVMNGAAATNSQPESLIEQFKDALTYST